MAEVFKPERLARQIIFLALAFGIAFVQLLPLSPGPGGLPGPDLILALSFAWVLRRPDFVPVLLVALVMLVTDFLFLRPPGLWAAITVLGLEFLRAREGAFRDVPFLLEWGMVSVVLTVMTLGRAAVLLIFFVDQPPLGLTLIELILTMMAYPVVVLVSVYLFGLRKAAPGEVDALGRRL